MDPPSTAANPIPNPSPLYNDFYTTTSCILNELLRTWQEKHTLVDKIRDYKLIPLTLDHQDTPIHERLGPDRLFDLIRVHVSAAEANSFTRALLVAFEECNRYNRFDESYWAHIGSSSLGIPVGMIFKVSARLCQFLLRIYHR